MTAPRKITLIVYSLMLTACLFMVTGRALAQTCVDPQVRVYATSEYSDKGLFTDVDDHANAADGDPSTASTIKRLLAIPPLPLGDVTQYLKFSSTVTAGTPVTLKLNLPTSLVSLLAGVQIQPFTGTNTAAGKAFSNAELVGLINGSGDTEITITPQTSGGAAVAYDGVWIKLTGIAIAQSLGVYDAYYTKTTAATAVCNTAMDALSGVRTNTILGSLANGTGSVSNPRNAIDADLNSYATIDIGAQAFSEAYHTTIFNTLSQPGDTVKMIVRNTGAGLLDLGLSSGFTIQLYNGTTAVGTPIAGSSSNLKLTLFPDASQKYELDVSPPAAWGSYDRVEVQIGGVVALGLTQGLRIYDVRRVIMTPATNIDGAAATAKAVCSGNTATLKVNNTQSCTTYNWYDAATGGTLLHTGDTFTPDAASLAATNSYYVEANRNGCSEVNVRTKATITVNPLPAIAHTVNPNLCRGSTSVGLDYTSVTNTPTTYSIVWSAAAISAGFNNVTDAVLPSNTIPITVPMGATPATYNGTLYVKNANGCLSTGEPFSIKVDAKPTQPVINLTP